MFQLYSKRIKNGNGEPEVYIYDSFPQEFRNQAFYAMSDVFDDYDKHAYSTRSSFWDWVHNSFCRECGLKYLWNPDYESRNQIENYIRLATDMNFLDFMDYTFNIIDRAKDVRPNHYSGDWEEHIDSVIIELNDRFKQHNLGYEFINGEIIRKDNELIHQEVIKPALKLLFQSGFEGAEQEFLDAFEHRRKGENKDAILDALKAFESTMKAICDANGYAYDPTKDTAKDLIAILEKNNFYPVYMNSHISALRSTLESGLPTLRNKKAGHGQGASVVSVSDEFAEYALDLAATNIVLLVKIHAAQKQGGN